MHSTLKYSSFWNIDILLQGLTHARLNNFKPRKTKWGLTETRNVRPESFSRFVRSKPKKKTKKKPHVPRRAVGNEPCCTTWATSVSRACTETWAAGAFALLRHNHRHCCCFATLVPDRRSTKTARSLPFRHTMARVTRGKNARDVHGRIGSERRLHARGVSHVRILSASDVVSAPQKHKRTDLTKRLGAMALVTTEWR